MEVSVKAYKIIKLAIYSIFFSSAGRVDQVFVRLSLIEQFIKDVNLMCISFIVKHPLIFR